MAKTNNLTDFLADLANAIREKEGSTEAINPQTFSTRILALETGGSGGGGGGSATAAIPSKAVNFRDYDGAVLFSYTKEDFLALSELPPLPTQKGLICQEWNWSLAEAKSYVQNFGTLDIGCNYITDDGKTRLYITISVSGRMDVPLYFSQTAANGVVVDWGDGSGTETFEATGIITTTHLYNKVGDFIITLKPTDGCVLGLGDVTTNSCVLGATSTKPYSNMLRKVEIGNNMSAIDNYAFNYCYSLKTISVPKNCLTFGISAFNYCYSLDSIVLPNGVSLGTSCFNYCYGLTYCISGSNTTNIAGSVFNYCYGLSSFVIPPNITTIEKVFYSCYGLIRINVPASVASIKSQAFYYCTGMKVYDFRYHTKVPSLAATSGFSSIPADCKIVVPDNLYNSWKSATNWSNSAIVDRIIKASEFNG